MTFPEKYRKPMKGTPYESKMFDPYGAFRIPPTPLTKTKLTRSLNIIAACAQPSEGIHWEHVSVTLCNSGGCPSWEEMDMVKRLFWDDSEAVMQLHPARSEHVNIHEGCLHLWRPTNQPIPHPPLKTV